MDKLVTIAEAAQQLSISIATVRGWRFSRKHLDFVKVGRAVTIPQKSIDKLIERQMVPHNCSRPNGKLRTVAARKNLRANQLHQHECRRQCSHNE